jgi:hypothetical protein
MGMEESNLQLMRGGSDDMAVLQAEIGVTNPDHRPAGGRLHVRWALLDRGLVLLIGAWALYALSFYVP